MKFGVTMPNNWGVEDLRQVLALNSGDVPSVTRRMESIARDVIPRFR